MESKVCSRSHGHPPGARRRAMMDTARSKRAPLVDIATRVPELVRSRSGRQPLAIRFHGLQTSAQSLIIKVLVKPEPLRERARLGAVCGIAILALFGLIQLS